MVDLSHLDALRVRLSHERAYLAGAKTASETELRAVWIAQVQREIEQERRFLGLNEEALPEMTDDEILAELGL